MQIPTERNTKDSVNNATGRMLFLFFFEMFVVRSDGSSKEKMKGFLGKKKEMLTGIEPATSRTQKSDGVTLAALRSSQRAVASFPPRFDIFNFKVTRLHPPRLMDFNLIVCTIYSLCTQHVRFTSVLVCRRAYLLHRPDNISYFTESSEILTLFASTTS